MQASYTGPLASYNSLTDEHLSEYYSRPRTFRHLRRMGLVTRDGRIIDEGIIRVNNARKEQKARSKGILANSIVNKAIELERKRRGDLKKKLELLEKYEIVEKVKSQKRHPAGIQEFNPYRSVPPPPPRLSTTLNMHFDQLSLSSDQIPNMKYLVGRITRGRSVPHPRPKSPYEEELASRFSSPVPHPPSTPRPHTAASARGRRSVISNRPNTAPSGMGMGPRRGTQRPIATRSQPVHSDVSITLKFIGTGLHLDSCSMESNTSDVMVVQQHCGGNTVPVYKGRVKPKDIFTFVSKRHIGMPYGLTIYLDGMMDSRVSACCEYRHQCGKLLGSKTAHFKLVKVEGGKPCYRCEIEHNKKYLQERQDSEIKHVLECTSSLQELTPPQKTATRDEESHMIHDSPLRSSSEVSGGSTEHLECQKSDTSAYQDTSQPEVHSDIAEKASLASHSNVSVSSRASACSKSSSLRVSVTSSKSSVHSHVMSTTSSKASHQSSKSSRGTSSEHDNPSPSCSSYSLREKESELSSSKLSPSREKDGTELGETASVDEYNYDDDKFEEEKESRQPPLEEHSDNNIIGPTLSEEKHNEPRETTDADANYNYESDTFEEPNGEEEPTKQQSEEHHTEEEISLSPTLVERNTESDKTTAPVVLNQQLGSESEAVGSSDDIEDNGQETQADSSHNIEDDEDKLSGPQTDDTPAMEQAESDENTVTEPEYEDTPVHVSVQESDKVSADPQASASGEEPTIETKSTDTTENQEEKQGILVTSSKRKPTQLAVSFEANVQESSTVKDLSASQTIEEVNNMLQKSQSNTSLGSDQESSLDLSGLDDEDIPDLEQKISDLIDESSDGGKTVSQENVDTAVKVGENKEESPSEIASADSQTRKLAADEKFPDLIDINRSGDKTLLPQNTDAATAVVNDENNSVEQERAGDGGSVSATLQVGGVENVHDLQLKVSDVSEEDHTGGDKSDSQETAVMDKEKEEDTVEQPSQESTSKDKESSQEDAGELENNNSFESGGLEDKNGHTVVLSEEENVKENTESPRLSVEVPAEDEGQRGRLDNNKDTVDPESDYSKDKIALEENVDTSAAVVEDVKERIEQLNQKMAGENEDVSTNPQEQGADGDKGELEQTVSNLIDDVRNIGKSGSQENMDTAVIVAGSEKEDTSPKLPVAENEKEGSPKLPDEIEATNSHTDITNEAQGTVTVGQDHVANAGSQAESQDYHQNQGDPEPTATSMPVEPSDHGSVASGLSLSSSKSSLTSVSSQASHS